MKKIVLFFCFTFLASSAFAQLYFQENFDYPAGDTNTLVSFGGWNVFSSTLNPIKISTPGLNYDGYPLSGIGNAVKLDTSGQDALKDFSGGNIDSIANMNGAAYISFMVNVSTTKLGAYVIAMCDSGSTTSFRARLYVKDSLGFVRFGIAKSAAADTVTGVAPANNPSVWSQNNYNYNTTYLIVMKYAYIPGPNNDPVSLFVFSSGMPSSEPVPTLGPLTFASSDANKIGRVLLRQGENTRGPRVNIDGIRVTTSWMPFSRWDVKIAVQGLYDQDNNTLNLADTVDIYLHDAVSPYAIIDSATAVVDVTTFVGSFVFLNAANGTYYLDVRYRKSPVFRNGIETWSSAGISFTRFASSSYDFTNSAGQAFGNNLFLKGSVFTIYNGDVNQDGIIDLTDLTQVFNATSSFSSGYLNTDLNGDGLIDLTDLTQAFNNSSTFVNRVIPS